MPGRMDERQRRRGSIALRLQWPTYSVAEIAKIKCDAAGYFIAPVLGLVAGWLEIKVSDLMLTALVVMIFTMLLGVIFPRRPWRWLLLVAVCVPILRAFAYFALAERASRAQIIESFLGFLTGTVGVYGGALMRRALQTLHDAK
jgi:hypothetical protein